MKIAVKLIVLLVTISMIVTIIGSYVFFLQGSRVIDERMDAHLESVIILKENQLKYFIDIAIKEIEENAELDLIQNYMKKFHYPSNTVDKEKEEEREKEISNLLNNKLNYTQFVEIFIMNMDGWVDLSTNMNEKGKIKSNENYFIEGKKGTYVQNFYYDLTIQQPVMTISTPIKDNEGNVLGVLAGRVNLEKISNFMGERTGLGDTGETYLVNKFNLLVSKSRFIEGIEFKKVIHTDAVKDCLKGNSGHSHYNDYRNVPVIGSYGWIPEREVCLLAKIDWEEAYAPINELRIVVISVGLGMVFLTIIIGIVLSRTITKPIIKLRDAAVEVGKGNLDVKAEVKTKDEIGELAKTFNRMTRDLRKSQEKLQKYSKDLEKEVKKRTRQLDKKIKQSKEATLASLNMLEDMEKTKKELAEAYKELKKLDKLKMEFMNIAAHELKTPLIPIIGYLDMLISGEMGHITKKEKEALNIVMRNARRLQRLVNDVLSISKLESGVMKFNMEKVNLENLLKNLYESMKPYANEKGISLKLNIPSKLPPIEGDINRLTEVFANLLDNAIKFTDKGGVYIGGEVKDNNIIIKVKDTGIGMSKEFMPKLFKKFQQEDTTARRKYGGTGLGLAISKQIVEHHKGKIWAESELGKGTTFYVSLPIKK